MADGLLLERALRRAAVWHRDQVRKGGDVPYVSHLAGVAVLLARAGFDEDVIAAGLLHDATEDTDATLDEIQAEFGPRVAELVAVCSEVKLDAEGKKRPWIDRKTDHLEALADAPASARAVILADKLHNLLSIQADLADGLPVWSRFNADRDRVLWYYRRSIAVADRGDDPRLKALADAARVALAAVEAVGEIAPSA
ncbi:MAG TPA: HD domain-containing protein [Isosphaeraceae bacterium]|jgi:(p)ppGpp synthase/HD superfamily hydrolase|nr:HD domain-containing protein [Isosphaeraceae bacterium]